MNSLNAGLRLRQLPQSGLAFKLYDPEGLLGDKDKTEYGITCALIPASHVGVKIGARHFPGSPFMNGTVEGEDVLFLLTGLLVVKKMPVKAGVCSWNV